MKTLKNKFNIHDNFLSLFEKIIIFGMLLVLIVFFISTGLPKVAKENNKDTISSVLPTTIIELTNKERESHNLQKLKQSSLLNLAAYLKAEDMKTKNYFDHYSSEGTSPWYWFDIVDYDYLYAGENLAIYFNDSGKVINAWMESPTHRDNILKKEYTEIGVATINGTYKGYDTIFIVQLFGTPEK